jgi:hypothetical protein
VEGLPVVSFDDHKVGTIAGRDGEYLIVEHGHLRKHRRALPALYATVDEAEGVVRVSVSREVIETAPELDDDHFDRQAVADHYGLVGDSEAPLTRGYGEVLPTDPAIGAEEEGASWGAEPDEQRRAKIQKELAAGRGPLDTGPPSPGVTGGDRYRDAGR